MNTYHIRYNTKHGESDLVWRIFENGQEYLVKSFQILVPVYGESTVEHGVQKWNVACQGHMTITDNVAVIS
jgi:hypothetical protein